MFDELLCAKCEPVVSPEGGLCLVASVAAPSLRVLEELFQSVEVLICQGVGLERFDNELGAPDSGQSFNHWWKEYLL